MLSGGSWVQIPAGSTTRVFKKTDEIMLAVILNLVSIQMIVSSVCVCVCVGGGGADVNPLASCFSLLFS